MRRVLPAVLLSVFVLAGCGSDEAAEPATETTVAPATTATGSETEPEPDGSGTQTDAAAELNEQAVADGERAISDLPHEVSGCVWDPEWEGTGAYTATGTITNNLGAEHELIVIVRFVTAGDVIQGTASQLLEPVADGATAEWAIGETGDGAGDGAALECEVLSARQSR